MNYKIKLENIKIYFYINYIFILMIKNYNI